MRLTSAVAWRAEVEGLGEIRYVVNTEHHRDHILGNAFLPGTVIAHELTRRQFLDSLGPVESVRERVAKFGPEELPLVADYRARLPEITVSEELTLHLGGVEIQLIEAHSRHLAPVGHRLSLLRLYDVLTMGPGAPPLPV